MPIEIRELVIRATVDPAGAGGTSGASCAGPSEKPQRGRLAHRDAHSDENLVQNCVREVLRVLADRRER